MSAGTVSGLIRWKSPRLSGQLSKYPSFNTLVVFISVYWSYAYQLLHRNKRSILGVLSRLNCWPVKYICRSISGSLSEIRCFGYCVYWLKCHVCVLIQMIIFIANCYFNEFVNMSVDFINMRFQVGQLEYANRSSVLPPTEWKWKGRTHFIPLYKYVCKNNMLRAQLCRQLF